MSYKFKKAIERNKKYFIMFGILWLLLVIVFVAPMACSIKEALVEGNNGANVFSFEQFFIAIAENIKNPFGSLGKSFGNGYISIFGKGFMYFSLAYLLLVMVGIIKSAPKTEYADIEHGSSDWSENGEQYRVLSKKEGIILAEDNYLPLDKMGNINTLIVGRIRFW